MEKVCFNGVDDDGVLEGIERVVRCSNEITAELLAYLSEVEKRGLHLREACSSLFAFCVERLHLSESAAGKRITAMRTTRRFPLVLEMIARGDIHLTAVNMLAPHLTDENHVELLGRARHQSKRAIEVLVAEIAPRPDVSSRITALAQRSTQVAQPATQVAQVEQPATQVAQVERPEAARLEVGLEVRAPERVERPEAARLEVGLEVRAPERVERPAIVAPLSPGRYEIRVTVDEETHGKLRQLQDLLAHSGVRDPAVIVARGIDALLEKTLAKKAAIVEKPRAQKPTDKRTRNIPAAVERTVWNRDVARCAFVDGKGRRCSATAFLEFHHVNNWARGAEHDASEMELRCRAHNQYEADLDYGAAFMARRRGDGSSRAGEPRASYRPLAGECAGPRERGRSGSAATRREVLDRAPQSPHAIAPHSRSHTTLAQTLTDGAAGTSPSDAEKDPRRPRRLPPGSGRARGCVQTEAADFSRWAFRRGA